MSSIVTNITIKPVDNNQNLSITQNEIKMNMLIYGGFEAVSFTYGDKTTAVTTEELEKPITKAKETPPKTSVIGALKEKLFLLLSEEVLLHSPMTKLSQKLVFKGKL